MMKRTLIITAVLILIALMVGMTVMAKKKAPKSQLKSFSYIRGGGMDIESNDEASLWRHPDGKLKLTLRERLNYWKNGQKDVSLHWKIGQRYA